MDIETAEKILEYGRVPTQAHELIELIQDAGYSKLRGRPLTACPSKQLYAVANRLYQEARSTPSTIRDAELQEFQAQEWETDWAENLYEMFNIPQNQRDEISPQELEARLLE